MAYNRDEAEVFGLDKALAAGYDELYSTAPEILDKKIAALDREIEAKAIEKAEDTVEIVRTEREKKLDERKARMEDIIDEMAKMIIQENEAYIGKEDYRRKRKKNEKKSRNRRKGGKGKWAKTS